MEEISRDLLMELMTEVLARLPVRSLVRLRSVCKAWCSLISSPDFASLHLSRYHSNDDNTHFLTATATAATYCLIFEWIVFSSNTFDEITSDDFLILDNQPIMDQFANFHPLGSSVNGLLLLYKELDPLDGHLEKKLMVWNPMIGKTHKLTTHVLVCHTYFGLGFSQSRNEYKVVAISAQPKTSVEVYSLSTGTWRSIIEYRESIIWELCSNGFVLIEGIIHFASHNVREQRSHLVLFDVTDEVFTYIDLPTELGIFTQRLYLVMYHENIGILSVDEFNPSCSLWVTENETWRKVRTIDLQVDTPVYILCFKNNGRFILCSEDGRAKLYDIQSGEVKHVRENSSSGMLYSTLCKSGMLYSTLCKESLVLL